MASTTVSSSASQAPPRWVILDRVALMLPEDAEGPRDAEATSTLPPPLGVARLTLPAALHPDPAAPDAQPYVLAADPDGGLLLNLARGPLTGFELALRPKSTSSLVLLRGFGPRVAAGQSGGGGAQCAASIAVRIPDRLEPPVCSLKSLGLVSNPSTDGMDYVVAELHVESGVHHAILTFFRSGAAGWVERKLTRPEMSGRTCVHWGWATDDVICHDGRLYWINLQQGLLSCNPFDEHPVLHLDQFPDTISEDYQFRSDRHVEAEKCVRVSRGRLRFVELTRAISDPPGATMIVVWTLMTNYPDGLSWWKHRSVTSLQHIWSSQAYKSSGMPEDVPILALISPTNPDQILFFLGQSLFIADVLEGRLVDFVIERMDVRPSAQLPISWRYVMAWELPPSLVTRAMSGRYCRESLILRNESAKLRNSQFALMIGGDTLKRLEEGLIHRCEEDSSWNKIQLVLFAVLASGLTCLFQFWNWLPKDFLPPIVVTFAFVWVLACVALPFALFGTLRCEIRLGHHAARAALMFFSTFVLYGLYRMCLIPIPAPSSGDSLAPAPSDSFGARWGWIDYSFIVLVAFSLLGQLISWIRNEHAVEDVHTLDARRLDRFSN